MSKDPKAASERPLNNLLSVLREPDYQLIASHLEVVQSAPTEVLYNPGDNVGTVYFPCGTGLVSLLVSNEDGRDVETILIGREGAVGGIVSSGNLPAYCRIVVKHGGQFARLGVNNLEAAKAKSSTLHHLFARYADCLLAQMFQSTACNAIHSIEQRAAKWIIAALERTGGDVVPLTQEQLAGMLGVGRSYTTRVMQVFKAAHILEIRRGSILVRDHNALNRRSCLCNRAVKQHFDEVLRGIYPPDVARATIDPADF
jgi:CRP-like cAMP-binding protein